MRSFASTPGNRLVTSRSSQSGGVSIGRAIPGRCGRRSCAARILSVRLRRLRIELVGLFQEFDNIVLVDNGRWCLDEAARELAIQGIYRNLKRNLAHNKRSCVDRGRQSAVSDLFEA